MQGGVRAQRSLLPPMLPLHTGSPLGTGLVSGHCFGTVSCLWVHAPTRVHHSHMCTHTFSRSWEHSNTHTREHTCLHIHSHTHMCPYTDAHVRTGSCSAGPSPQFMTVWEQIQGRDLYRVRILTLCHVPCCYFPESVVSLCILVSCAFTVQFFFPLFFTALF